MARKVPQSSPPNIQLRKNSGNEKQIRHYKLITPLYGGGEEPARADSISVIRATEVRGHLRFWWRATRGSTSRGNLRKLLQLEEQIWGSPAKKGRAGPSKVSVSINLINKGTKFQALDRKGRSINNIGNPNSIDSYVGFPLREESNPILLENIEFELVVTFPSELKDEVNAALWAWETFGGIGARTRRGFGALQCIKNSEQSIISVSTREIHNQIKNDLDFYIADGSWPAGIPHLTKSLRFVTKKNSDSMTAWRFIIQKYKIFRQTRFPDRNGNPYGRSKWPEPDAIRRLSGRSAATHQNPRTTLDKFPRSKFGLPIIFQFKENDVALGDPPPTTLQGIDKFDRLASPLILRPIVCSDGAVGLSALLEWMQIDQNDEPYTPPGGLELKLENGNLRVNSDLTIAEAGTIPPLNNNSDILHAFLDFLN